VGGWEEKRAMQGVPCSRYDDLYSTGMSWWCIQSGRSLELVSQTGVSRCLWLEGRRKKEGPGLWMLFTSFEPQWQVG
jgi:hypothetical protein